MLRATTPGCTTDCLRHREGRAVLSPLTRDSAPLDRSDATWVVRRGLAGGPTSSLESRNFPGHFLRHRGGRLVLDRNDGGALFAQDASFSVEAGRSGQGVSLASVNFPDHFVRHFAGEVFIAGDGGPEPWAARPSWADDVTWLAQPAWRA